MPRHVWNLWKWFALATTNFFFFFIQRKPTLVEKHFILLVDVESAHTAVCSFARSLSFCRFFRRSTKANEREISFSFRWLPMFARLFALASPSYSLIIFTQNICNKSSTQLKFNSYAELHFSDVINFSFFVFFSFWFNSTSGAEIVFVYSF